MLRVFRHKKGMKELYKLIIELVLAIMVTVAAITYAVSVGSGTRIIKEKTARDVALTIEAVQAPPGAVFFSYADTKGFTYGFAGNKVSVYAKDDDTSADSNTYYYFPKDSALNFIIPKDKIALLEGQKNTVISMKKNYPNFELNSNDLSLEAMTCEKISDISKDPKVIIIYDTSEQDIIHTAVENLLKPKLGAVFQSQDIFTFTGEGTKDQMEAKANEVQGAIVLQIADNPGTNTDVKLSINADKKSRRLGCIARNILESKRISSAIVSQPFPGLKNSVIMKAEIGGARRGTAISNIGEAVSQYFT